MSSDVLAIIYVLIYIFFFIIYTNHFTLAIRNGILLVDFQFHPVFLSPFSWCWYWFAILVNILRGSRWFLLLIYLMWDCYGFSYTIFVVNEHRSKILLLKWVCWSTKCYALDTLNFHVCSSRLMKYWNMFMLWSNETIEANLYILELYRTEELEAWNILFVAAVDM